MSNKGNYLVVDLNEAWDEAISENNDMIVDDMDDIDFTEYEDK